MCEFYELNSIKVSGRMWIFSTRKVNFLLIYQSEKGFRLVALITDVSLSHLLKDSK